MLEATRLATLVLLEGPSSVYQDSLELYKMVLSLPPGVLASNPSLAYRIALLASIQREPPYVDPNRLQVAFKHLTGAEVPIVGAPAETPPAAHANPLTPPSEELNEALSALADLMGTPEVKEKLGESLVEEAKGLEEVVKGVEEAVKSGNIDTEQARLTLELLKAIQDIIGSEEGNVKDVSKAIKKLREILEESGGTSETKNVEAKLPSLSGSKKQPMLNPIPSHVPEIRVAMPRVQGTAFIPPKKFLALIAVVLAAPLAYMLIRRINTILLKARIRSYAERVLESRSETINPVIELFSKILEVVGSRCRPRYSYETHREYASVLDEPSLSSYARASKVYELVKFGGRSPEPKFIETLRSSLEELVERVVCRVARR